MLLADLRAATTRISQALQGGALTQV